MKARGLEWDMTSLLGGMIVEKLYLQTYLIDGLKKCRQRSIFNCESGS